MGSGVIKILFFIFGFIVFFFYYNKQNQISFIGVFHYITRYENKIKALIQTTYPHNYPAVIVVVLGLAMGEVLTPINFLKAAIISWFPLTTCMIINVVTDWKEDAINGKNAFIHKYLTKNEMVVFYLLFVLISILLCINGNLYLQISVVSMILVGIFYSVFRFKDKLFLNYLCLGIGYGLLPPAIGLFSFTFELTYLNALMLFISGLFLFLGCQIKDFEDAKGDKKGSTLAHLPHSIKIYISYHFLFFAFLLLLIIQSFLPTKFIISFVVFPLFLVILYKLVKSKTKTELRSVHINHHLLTNITIGIFAVCFII